MNSTAKNLFDEQYLIVLAFDDHPKVIERALHALIPFVLKFL